MEGTKPLSGILQTFANSATDLCRYGKEEVRSLANRSSVPAVAGKVYDYLKSYPDLFFTGVTVFHAMLSPLSFSVGMIAGFGCKIGYHCSLISAHIPGIESDEDKIVFGIATLISMLAIKTMIRGLVSGFLVGDYLANKLHKPIIQSMQSSPAR